MNDGILSKQRQLVLRNTTRWFLAAFYLSFAAIGVVVAVLTSNVPVMIFYLLAAAAFAVLGVRGARSAVWMSEVGVTARADRFTRHLAWAEIDRFELRPRRLGGLWPGEGLGAWRRNGDWVRLMDQGVDSKHQYDAALQVLQAEVARRRYP
jgi:hypothetical protein